MEQFNNGLMKCRVLARKGRTALILIENNGETPYVVPLEHIEGQKEWYHGSYYRTLDAAYADYEKR